MSALITGHHVFVDSVLGAESQVDLLGRAKGPDHGLAWHIKRGGQIFIPSNVFLKVSKVNNL